MLEYEDIFEGSKVIAEKISQLKGQIREEMDRIAKFGGTATQEALEYMKERLVASQRRARRSDRAR